MYRGVPEDAGISVLGRSSFVSEQFFYFAVSPGEPKSLMESLMAENNAVLVNIRVYSVRYRCGCHTEVSGTGIDVVPNLPKCPVPVIPAYIPPVCLGTYRAEHTLGKFSFQTTYIFFKEIG